jgi:serine/threonine-protein kinase
MGPKPKALSAFRAAFQAWQSGQIELELRLLGEAVRLDPAFGAARMRLAIAAMLADKALPGDIRANASAALQRAEALSQRDQAILAAFEPAIARVPADTRECARRVSALAAAHREDTELGVLDGMAAQRAGRLHDAEAAFRRALEAEPSLPIARAQLADVLADLGRSDEAERILEPCLDGAAGADAGPDGAAAKATSPACRLHRMLRERADGRCDAMAADARVLAATDTPTPIEEGAPRRLTSGTLGAVVAEAQARAALGAPVAEIEQLAARARTEGPPGGAVVFEAPIAMLAGKLDEARASAERRATSTVPDDVLGRAIASRTVIDLALETGDLAGAGKVAAAIRAELGAGDAIADVANDPRPRLAAVELRAGLIGRDEADRLLSTWEAAWRARADDDAGPWVAWRRWVVVRGSGVETADEARGALALAPTGSPGPAFDMDPLTFARVYGRVLLRAGRADDAIPFLRRAAATCSWSLPQVLGARLDLADALAQRGDRAGACASYTVVLARWSDAKPRSVTAEAARAAAKKAGCGI